MPILTRRDLGRMMLGSTAGAGMAGALGIPRLARASGSASERRFIFLFLRGGWDTSYLTPLYDNDNVDCPTDGEPAEVNGISYVASENRTSMTEFFENWGHLTCMVNGIEVPSVAHDRCIRLTLTGGTAVDADDWPSILAARYSKELLMPHTVVSGPGFAAGYGSYVVRVGLNGQLGELMDATALARSDIPIPTPDADLESVVDAFVRGRAEDYYKLGHTGQANLMADRYASMLNKFDGVASQLEGVELGAEDRSQQAALCVSVLERNLSRCALMEHLGLFDAGFDTHASNVSQDSHFRLAFETLNELMEGLNAAESPSGSGTLLDDTVVVVMSEMGRSPKLNGQAGKDHWTYTSALVIGGGVRGGQVVGAYADDVTGEPIDFATGEITASGKGPDHRDFGATLLALGDVDPGDYLNQGEPIMAVIDG